MLGIGWLELALVAVVALLLIGPRQLPQVARHAGRSWQAVKRWRDELKSTLEDL